MSESLPNTTFQVLQFKVQEMNLCMELLYIDQVLLLPWINAVPNGPSYLLGLMNVAGKSVPVIDLGMKLGLVSDQPYTVNTPLLLCHRDQELMGLVIDEISGLALVNSENIQPMNEFEKQSLFNGVVPLDSILTLVVNAPFVLEKIGYE